MSPSLSPVRVPVPVPVPETARNGDGESADSDSLTARGSATESAALLDVGLRLEILEEIVHRAGKEMLVRVVSMLIKLAQACEE